MGHIECFPDIDFKDVNFLREEGVRGAETKSMPYESACPHTARLRKHLLKVHASDSLVEMLVPSMIEFFNKHFGKKGAADPTRTRQTGPANGIAMEKQVFRVLHTLHMCGVYFGQITPDCICWEGSSVRFTNLHHLMYVDVKGEDVLLYHPTHRLFDWPVDEYSPYEHIYFEVAIRDRSKRVASLDSFQKCLDTTYPEMFARLSHPAALNDVCRVAMIFIKHSPSGLLMKLNHLRECIYPYDERIIDPVEVRPVHPPSLKWDSILRDDVRSERNTSLRPSESGHHPSGNSQIRPRVRLVMVRRPVRRHGQRSGTDA